MDNSTNVTGSGGSEDTPGATSADAAEGATAGDVEGTPAGAGPTTIGTDPTPGATSADAADGPGAPAGTGGTAAGDAARVLAAVAMLGAAVIHFAFAPEHLDEETSHGVFFLVVGWSQLLGAGALAFSWRPRRTWLLGTAVVNAAVAAIWLLTRTAGLPGDEAEAVGFPDSLASALEVIAAVAALAVAFGWLAERPVRRPTFAFAGLPAVAVVALVTASVIPSVGGGGHTHGEGRDDGTSHDAGDGSGELAAGHEHVSSSGQDDEWSAQRVAALTGYLPDEELERLRDINSQYLADQIRNRSRALRSLPEDEREVRIAAFVEWSVANALEAENGEGSDGEPTMHSHGISEWQPITEPADQLALQAQLQTAGTVIQQVPTAADAVAAGYFQVTPYVPGIGAHYLNIDLLQGDGFDPARPEMLLYNGNEPTSMLVGLSYAVLADEAPEGFVGPNDQWHLHPSLCIIGSMVVGPDSTPEEMCDSVGGRKGMTFDKPMWMGHLWQVPGWESPWGLFSGENPVVNLATSDVGR